MSSFQKKGPDEVRLMRGLVTVLLLIGTIISAAFAIRSGSLALMIGLIALPFAIMLMHRPQETFVLALILDATGMAIPGVSYTSLGLIAKVLLIVIFAMGFVMGRRLWKGEAQAEKKPLLCFAGLILLLMSVRGSGIRMLGSSSWGGMIYIILFIGIIFYFAVNGLRLQGKQIQWIVWGSLLAGLIGAALRLKGFSAAEEAEGVSVTRLRWLMPIATALFPIVFALKLKKAPWVSALLLLISLTMIGLTGFRSKLVGVVMVAVGYGFFKARSKIKYIMIMGLFGVVAWGGIIVISPALPSGIQRSISFVPGARVAIGEANDAKGSIEWRVEIWKYCMEQSTQYLLLGRGSAFDVRDTVGELGVNDVRTISPWFAFQTRVYHSGPLSLLIDYGIPGLLIALWLTILVIKRCWGFAQRMATFDTFESRYALFLCVSLLWQWVAFYLVYGDMPGFSRMIVGTAVAIVIAESVIFREKRT
jgi:hypothetical protein